MGRPTTPYMNFARAHFSEYAIWIAMRQRCFNPNHAEYPNYGGRGISVCARWNRSFRAFYDDMGPRPVKGTIDRIDNSGDYEPGNCRWTDMKAQNRNRRGNNYLTKDGETLTITDWAAKLGIHPQTLRNRLKRGWSAEEALSTTKLVVKSDPVKGTFLPRER